ncbi:MAG: hypothetical protein EBZ49_16255, partial [Proteobacteria bacterium]|nr:hypothetical protein [Pseudomonadota bacterium]
MAKIILPAGSYSYIPAAQQVNFSNFTTVTGFSFDFTRLLAIIDVTQGRIIYSTSGSSSGLGGTFSFPILTLVYNTTSFPGGDLQIIYDFAQDYGAGITGPATQRMVIATDQTKIPSQISDGINNVAIKPALIAPVASDPSLVVAMSPNSALPLPTGAATSALQTTGNLTLSTISGKLPAVLGTQTIANSMAVNIASDQIVPTSLPDLFITGQSGQSAIINNIIPATASATAT